jgi:filamentous hemagglutinin family protein
MKHWTASITTIHRHVISIIAIVWAVVGLQGMWIAAGLAQAPPITPSGLNTRISSPHTLPSGKVQYDITGGTRPGRGTNLFHSFGNFNVPTNNIANFLNDSALPTSNILGRVTGGNVSNIFGAIQTTGFGNANLFLINPAGFLFGPNATLNVGGMAAFSSADYLRLADGMLFNAIASPNADALLSAAPVAAFGFLGTNPGAITVQGSQLSVAPGQSLSLIGGSITIQSGTLDNGAIQPARLSAPNGQINLASTASPGEFVWQSLQTGGFLEFPTPFGSVTEFIGQSLAGPNINGAAFTSFANIHFAPGATVDTSHTGNGKVSIVGGELVVNIQNAVLSTADTPAPPAAAAQNSVVISPGSTMYSLASSAAHGPDVEIAADSIQLSGTPIALPAVPTPAHIATQTSGSGSAGNISLRATHNIELFDAQVVSAPGAPLPATTGTIDVTSAQGSISLTSQSLVSTQGDNVGIVSLRAPHGDILLDSSIVNTIILPGIGPPVMLGADAGGIRIAANNLTLRNTLGLNPSTIEGDNFTNPQVPGNIAITLSGSLSIEGGSSIQTISRGPAAAAADLNISARHVSVNGTGMDFDQVAHSQINTQTISTGTGGQLTIEADDVQLTNGGQLRSGSVIGRDPLSGEPTNPSGHGGTITIQGPSGPSASVLIDGAGSGIFTNTEGAGPGGNTNISTQSLTIHNSGTISAGTSGTASSATGGTISVKAGTVTLDSGGTMTAASTGAGPSGEVVVQGLASPAQSLFIDGSGSGIFTDAHGTGLGGSISVNANAVTMTNGATISANSSGAADAGNINITANHGLSMQSSSITTQVTPSNGGTNAGGGDIKITTSPSATIYLQDSTISASVGDGRGGGGNISLDPQYVILQNGRILAQAADGAGGSIGIIAGLFLPDTASVVNADSGSGLNGSVSIQSPISQAGGRIQPLGKSPLLSTSLVNQRCAALAGGNFSSFTVAGRDSLPAEPSGWLSSPLALQMPENGADSMESSQAEEDDVPLLSLRQIAPPGFLTQGFALDGSEGCTS